MKKSIYHLGVFIIILSITLTAILTQSCSKDEEVKPDPPVIYERGDVTEIINIGTYSIAEIQQRIDAAGIQSPFDLNFSVDVFSLSYSTIDSDGNNIICSGAIFIPQGNDNLSILSMQHGTETKRELVASVSPDNSVEGLIGLMTSSMGYLSIAADYPGFGVSNTMHPYLHQESIVPCVIDLLKAGKTYCLDNSINLSGELFLTGYSEGGYISLLTQKEIEANYANEFKLTAVAPLSGPYDLKGMVDSVFQTASYSTPTYIAYFMTAYNNIYGWNRLDDIFQSPYSTQMQGFFNGSKTWGEIVNQLPADLSDLLEQDFIDSYNSGNETEFRNAIVENTLISWIPVTPIHFFHGDADEIVPIQNAITAKDQLSIGSVVQIQLTTIPGGTHESSGPAAIFGAIEWFDGFKN